MGRGNWRISTSLAVLEPQDASRQCSRGDGGQTEGEILPLAVPSLILRRPGQTGRKCLEEKTERRRLCARVCLLFVVPLWRWISSSELWPLCSAAPAPPPAHWILLGRTSVAASGTFSATPPLSVFSVQQLQNAAGAHWWFPFCCLEAF